jgi:hypothetical protein
MTAKIRCASFCASSAVLFLFAISSCGSSSSSKSDGGIDAGGRGGTTGGGGTGGAAGTGGVAGASSGRGGDGGGGTGGSSGTGGGGNGRGGDQGGSGGGQAGGAGGTGAPVDAGACRTQGQTCSATERCCVPLICAGGCTMAPSDRNLKRDFAPIDGEQILNSLAELPITSWRYKTESGDARHIGPMAQDFKARFGVGTDDKYILQVDADGVALAAIKTLNDRVNRLARENAELRREVSRLHVSKTKTH